MARVGPNAALHVDWTGSVKPGPQGAVYFFKSRQYIRWRVDEERLDDGYPREIAQGWPGLLQTRPGVALSGAMHVPGWHNRIHFMFQGDASFATWNVEEHCLEDARVPIGSVMPSALTEDGHFTPLYVDDGQTPRVYAFRGDAYTRFTVNPGQLPRAEDDGYPRKIGDGWTGGFLVAPTCAVCVHWIARSDALARRKIYFFLGDLYTRWDVASHSKNYRLDVPSGWKGWPDFE